jgi:hypothetical protein
VANTENPEDNRQTIEFRVTPLSIDWSRTAAVWLGFGDKDTNWMSFSLSSGAVSWSEQMVDNILSTRVC